MHITPATWVDPGASTADPGGTRPVVLVEASSAATPANNPSQDAFNRLASISLGREFQAQVVARQKDGTHFVRVADTTARMVLPEAKNPGDIIALKLVSASPRPTFLLGETIASAGTEQQVGGNTAISKAQMEAFAAAQRGAGGAPQGTPTSLSSTGKMIDTLLLAAQLSGSPSRLEGGAPLVPTAATSPGAMAQAISNAVEFSGLFYESHLAEWSDGSRTLENLMREPQAKFSGEKMAELASQLGERLQTAGNRQPLIDLMRALEIAQGQEAEPTDKAVTAQLSTLNEETAQLLSMQLSALENRNLVWFGEIWPGQGMEWEVSEETPEGSAEETEAIWNSELKLSLPALGEVRVSIRMVGSHVQMHLRTETEDAAASLRNFSTELATALDSASAPLDLLTVSHGENE